MMYHIDIKFSITGSHFTLKQCRYLNTIRNFCLHIVLFQLALNISNFNFILYLNSQFGIITKVLVQVNNYDWNVKKQAV